MALTVGNNEVTSAGKISRPSCIEIMRYVTSCFDSGLNFPSLMKQLLVDMAKRGFVCVFMINYA